MGRYLNNLSGQASLEYALMMGFIASMSLAAMPLVEKVQEQIEVTIQDKIEERLAEISSFP